MLPLLSSNTNTNPPDAPDYINISIYLYDTATYTPIYNEEHHLLGYKGPYSYRPNGNPGVSGFGAIELINGHDASKRLSAIVKYKWNNGIVVKVLQLD